MPLWSGIFPLCFIYLAQKAVLTRWTNQFVLCSLNSFRSVIMWGYFPVFIQEHVISVWEHGYLIVFLKTLPLHSNSLSSHLDLLCFCSDVMLALRNIVVCIDFLRSGFNSCPCTQVASAGSQNHSQICVLLSNFWCIIPGVVSLTNEIIPAMLAWLFGVSHMSGHS